MTQPPQGRSDRSALECARQWAEEAGAMARDMFRRPQDVTVKGRGDLLTETDLEVERFLRNSIASEFPGHGILSEETAPNASDAGWVWVVDPIDGTRNFVSGIPFFCVNIALCLDGTPVVVVTCDPVHDEVFWAVRGSGAWMNDTPIRASEKLLVRESVLGIDLGYDDARGHAMLRMANLLFPNVQSLRIPGSAALGLAYAACGRYDLFVHHYLFPWDIAAGLLLVSEAGGEISERDGTAAGLRSTSVVAGGPGVHDDFLEWLEANRTNLDPLD